MTNNQRIQIIGLNVIGEAISDKTRCLVSNADMLVGGRRHLGLFPDYAGKKVLITKTISPALSEIKKDLESGLKVVVLASGDPLLFGIGNTLIKYFGSDAVEVMPAVSSAQAALTRLGFDTHNVVVLSCHGRKAIDLKPLRFFPCSVILTGSPTGPAEVIRRILSTIPEADFWQGSVCQCLGMADEKIVKDNLKRLSKQNYLTPNLVVIENPAPRKISQGRADFGRPDDAFSHSGNMITHPEVRAVTLSKLALNHASLLWDVGAGSGAVGIEAALLNPGLKVISIEKKAEQLNHIVQNAKKMDVKDLEVRFGNALNICPGLPKPDRIFIGGGGRDLKQLVPLCFEALNQDGILVANTVTIESFATLADFTKKFGHNAETLTLQISRMTRMTAKADYRVMNPDNPITIFKVNK